MHGSAQVTNYNSTLVCAGNINSKEFNHLHVLSQKLRHTKLLKLKIFKNHIEYEEQEHERVKDYGMKRLI